MTPRSAIRHDQQQKSPLGATGGPHRQTISEYADIDWHLLWSQARDDRSWRHSTAADWDRKAEGYAERVLDSPFVDQVLEILDLDATTTVLDVGCGPGTLALPLARKVQTVTALDYSAGMLEQLHQLARQQHLANIRTVHCGWEDDWHAHQIGRHDIVIASRSLNIPHLAAGIAKLDRFSRRMVYLIERVAPTPFDPHAFAAVGRPFRSGPDYIFALNFLYTRGIHPHVRQIELAPDQQFRDMDQALQRAASLFKDLNAAETKKLAEYLADRIVEQTDERVIIRSGSPQRWAVLSWRAGAPEERNRHE